MMVFEAAFVGVLVPRGMPGRGTAVDDEDVPVEFQGYWTPDPRRAQKKNNIEDLVILDRLRAVACGGEGDLRRVAEHAHDLTCAARPVTVVTERMDGR